MKIVLIIGLFVSNGLWLAAYFNGKQGEPRAAYQPPAHDQQSEATSNTKTGQQQKATPSLPSSWSELESEEYAIFIRNLRVFGCPDATINHIVEGELREMQEERKSLQAIITSQLRKTDPRRLQAEEKLRQLDRTNNQIVSQLLSATTPSGAPAIADGNQNGSKSGNAARRPQPVRVPLVMSGVTLQPQSTSNVGGNTQNPAFAGPGVLVTTPEQAATIQKLQQNFINAVGGTNQDPADPNYLKNWQAAQPTIDQMYYTLYGQEAYYQYQKAAATKAYAESQSGK